jgi:hypothetical protein
VTLVSAAAVTDGHCGSRTSRRSVRALKSWTGVRWLLLQRKIWRWKNNDPWPDLCGVAKGRGTSRGKEEEHFRISFFRCRSWSPSPVTLARERNKKFSSKLSPRFWRKKKDLRRFSGIL